MRQRALVMAWCAAAREDAKPVQGMWLREAVNEVMPEFGVTGDPDVVISAIRRVMGADYEPSGKYAVMVEGMK